MFPTVHLPPLTPCYYPCRHFIFSILFQAPFPAPLFCLSISFLWKEGLSKITSFQQCQQPLPPIPPLSRNLCVCVLLCPLLDMSVNCNKCKHVNKSSGHSVTLNNSFWHVNKPLRKDLRLCSQWTKFLWHSCYKMAWNLCTLVSQNFRHTWLLNWNELLHEWQVI
jgi:hypothetical protein